MILYQKTWNFLSIHYQYYEIGLHLHTMNINYN